MNAATSRGVKCSPPPLLYRVVGRAIGVQVNAIEGFQCHLEICYLKSNRSQASQASGLEIGIEVLFEGSRANRMGNSCK
jgi:hypothetical protein